jgi:uncharacterized protein (DUF3820 family)
MRKFISRKQNLVLYGKYKGKNINSVPLNYLLWVQNNIYNEMSNPERNVIDMIINKKIEKSIHQKTKNEFDFLKIV